MLFTRFNEPFMTLPELVVTKSHRLGWLDYLFLSSEPSLPTTRCAKRSMNCAFLLLLQYAIMQWAIVPSLSLSLPTRKNRFVNGEKAKYGDGQGNGLLEQKFCVFVMSLNYMTDCLILPNVSTLLSHSSTDKDFKAWQNHWIISLKPFHIKALCFSRAHSFTFVLMIHQKVYNMVFHREVSISLC